MDRGAGQAIVHRVTKESDMTEHTHTHTDTHICMYVCVVFAHIHIFPRLCQSHSRVGEVREESTRSWLVAFLKPEVIILLHLAPPFNLNLVIS